MPPGKENTMASKCRNRLTSVPAWLVTAVLLGGCAGLPNPGGDTSAGSAKGGDRNSNTQREILVSHSDTEHLICLR